MQKKSKSFSLIEMRARSELSLVGLNEPTNQSEQALVSIS